MSTSTRSKTPVGFLLLVAVVVAAVAAYAVTNGGPGNGGPGNNDGEQPITLRAAAYFGADEFPQNAGVTVVSAKRGVLNEQQSVLLPYRFDTTYKPDDVSISIGVSTVAPVGMTIECWVEIAGETVPGSRNSMISENPLPGTQVNQVTLGCIYPVI